MNLLANRRFWLVLLFLLVLPRLSVAENIPMPSGWVNDYANVISPEYRSKLSSLIQELEEKTSAEIFVATFESIAPYDEKGYARLIFDSWKPGKKGKDNGVLVFVAIKERRWRIETGYGVEGILPDGLVGEIGRNYMVPYLKEGKYGQGLYNGVAAITGVIAKDAKVDISVKARKARTAKPKNDGRVGLAIFLAIIVGIPVFFSLGPPHWFEWIDRYGGGGFGDGAGGFGGFGGDGGGGGGDGGGGGGGGGGAGGGF